MKPLKKLVIVIKIPTPVLMIRNVLIFFRIFVSEDFSRPFNLSVRKIPSNNGVNDNGKSIQGLIGKLEFLIENKNQIPSGGNAIIEAKA
ncbi:MAG: hypothetical protein Q7U53_20045 [Anaerolineaceae bacterium]|nr:hypothetical protein [Anaerolineaceae bacterium]